MKTTGIHGALLFALAGCLGQSILAAEAPQDSGTNRSQAQVIQFPGSTNPPLVISAVVTPEFKEKRSLKQQAGDLLAEREFDKLEALAEKYRKSNESYADGEAKLVVIYNALEPAKSGTNTKWEGRIAELRNWVNVKPDSATAAIGLARCLTQYAWDARGAGYADTVSDEGWKLFSERLAEAAKVLLSNPKLKDRCPVYWSSLMRIAVGLEFSKQQFDSVFHQARAAFPEFEAFYTRRAIYLLPRWHGDPGEWEADLAKSADAIGGDKGDLLYAQVVWNMHHSVNFNNLFRENAISWARTDRGFAEILKRYPDSLAAKNERAHLAVLAGDVNNAAKYFRDTQGKADLSEWKDLDQFTRFARAILAPVTTVSGK